MTSPEPVPRKTRPGRLPACVAIATTIHAVAVTLGLMFPIHSGFATKKKNGAYDDIRLYLKFAGPILEGRWPYRDYPVEYPILSIPVFAAPLVAGSNLDTYKIAFVVEMLLFDAVLTWLVARQVEATAGIEQVPPATGLVLGVFPGDLPVDRAPVRPRADAVRVRGGLLDGLGAGRRSGRGGGARGAGQAGAGRDDPALAGDPGRPEGEGQGPGGLRPDRRSGRGGLVVAGRRGGAPDVRLSRREGPRDRVAGRLGLPGRPQAFRGHDLHLLRPRWLQP